MKSNQIVFLNYGKSGKLLLSKITFTDKYEVFLFSSVPQIGKEGKKELMAQDCNLSARNKGRKIIATTYQDEHLKNVVVLDFERPRGSVFLRVFSHHGGPEVSTSYLVAVISEYNQKEEPRELEREDIDKLQAIPVFSEAIQELDDLTTQNLKYLKRSQSNKK